MEHEYEVKLWVRYAEGGFEMQKFTTKAKSASDARNKAQMMAVESYGHHCVSDIALHYCREITKDNKRV